GRHLLGRDRQVPFVLAVLVVHHDQETPRRELADRVLDRRERRPVPAVAALAVPAPAHDAWSSRMQPCRTRCSRVTAGCGRPPGRRSLRYSTTYRPIMSTSRLTGVPAARSRRCVTASVSGIRATSNDRSPRDATVRLTPSTAIDPFRTMHSERAAGNPISS